MSDLSSVAMTVWDGTTETPVTPSIWNGSSEVALAQFGLFVGGNTPPRSDLKILSASISGYLSGQDSVETLDSSLASAVSTTTPLLKGGHFYSGNSFPATFAQSNAAGSDTAGYGWSLLNVKCDWTQLSDGTLDQHITDFVDSIPAGHRVYLLINHEPENDNNAAGHGVWQDGQARAANLIASLNDDRCYYGLCLMSYTWNPKSNRTPNDWNPADAPNVAMTQAALDRSVATIDVYTKVRNASGTDIDSFASQCFGAWDDFSAWGFTKFGISEHSLNNDIGGPIDKIIDWWETDHIPYLRQLNPVFYAFYNHSGPASGNNYMLDTTQELQMFGQFCLEQNRE